MPGTYPRRAARLVGSKLLLLFQESRNEGNRVIPKSYAQIQEGAGRCALPAEVRKHGADTAARSHISHDSSEMISPISPDVFVLESGEDECCAGYLLWVSRANPRFPAAAQVAQQRVPRARADIESRWSRARSKRSDSKALPSTTTYLTRSAMARPSASVRSGACSESTSTASAAPLPAMAIAPLY